MMTSASTASPQDAGASEPQWVELAPGRTNIVRVEVAVGDSVERQPAFVAKVPSYRRAIALDREQRWVEAAALYEEAAIEVGNAVKLDTATAWEQASFKIDLERRRSQVLAHARGEPGRRTIDRRGLTVGPRRAGATGAAGAHGLAAADRGRLLRLKLMSVRAATGSVPALLFSATIGALQAAIIQMTAAGQTTADGGSQAPTPPRVPAAGVPGARPGSSPGPQPSNPSGEPEMRLLLCAARAAGGDWAGARLELAHVRQADRTDPVRALPMASCQAALRQDDQALASLAVAVYRLGPASRFLPGQTRELQSSNDWDHLRRDPRFERIFR